MIFSDETVNTLYKACISGDLNTLEKTLKKPQVNYRNKNGISFLHICVYCGHYKLVRHLILMGASVNSNNTNGDTPLLISVIKKYDNITKLLLNNKANPILKNNKGITPLHCAVINNDIDILILLLIHTKSSNIDLEDNNGNTPIHYSKNLEILKLLVNNSGNINYKNKDGNTVLHLNIEDESFVNELVKIGSDITISNNDNISYLDHIVNI